MTYEFSYDPLINAINVVTHGTASSEELCEMVRRLAGLCGEQKTANIIIDHTDLDARLMTMDNVDFLSSVTASLKYAFRKRKVAHIVAHDYQFGFIRAWEMMVENTGFTEVDTMVFKSRAAAVEWLRSGS